MKQQLKNKMVFIVAGMKRTRASLAALREMVHAILMLSTNAAFWKIGAKHAGQNSGSSINGCKEVVRNGRNPPFCSSSQKLEASGSRAPDNDSMLFDLNNLGN